MSVNGTYRGAITVIETPTANAAWIKASDSTITIDGLNLEKGLNAGSTPPASKHAASTATMTAGAKTIDLTAIVGLNGGNVDGTGLKVRAFKFRAPLTNANPVTLAVGAANGYELLGSDWKVTLQPGQEAQGYLADGAPVIGGGAKTIDVSGTGAQGVDVQILMG